MLGSEGGFSLCHRTGDVENFNPVQHFCVLERKRTSVNDEKVD